MFKSPSSTRRYHLLKNKSREKIIVGNLKSSLFQIQSKLFELYLTFRNKPLKLCKIFDFVVKKTHFNISFKSSF
jgi:hypothetical protein